MSVIKKVKREYYNTFTDAFIIKNIIEIVEEVFAKKYPDDTPMTVCFTVGEVGAAKGFYTNETMMKHITDALIARSVRGCFVKLGIPIVVNAPLLHFLKETDQQRDRVVPIIITKLIDKYGVPDKIDHGRIAELNMRVQLLDMRRHIH